MSTSKRAKQLGAKSLKQIEDRTGLSRERLNTLFADYPVAFDSLVLGLTYRDDLSLLASKLKSMAGD